MVGFIYHTVPVYSETRYIRPIGQLALFDVREIRQVGTRSDPAARTLTLLTKYCENVDPQFVLGLLCNSVSPRI